jgi:hypothetical protein
LKAGRRGGRIEAGGLGERKRAAARQAATNGGRRGVVWECRRGSPAAACLSTLNL